MIISGGFQFSQLTLFYTQLHATLYFFHTVSNFSVFGETRKRFSLRIAVHKIVSSCQSMYFILLTIKQSEASSNDSPKCLNG